MRDLPTTRAAVAIVRDGETGTPVATIVRRHHISASDYYDVRSMFAGAGAAELERVREFVAEHGAFLAA